MFRLYVSRETLLGEKNEKDANFLNVATRIAGYLGYLLPAYKPTDNPFVYQCFNNACFTISSRGGISKKI